MGAQFDVCIAGAGVAGTAMASYLGQAGFRVALIERDWSPPDQIIGELLQPSGAQLVGALGFGDAFEGYEAQPIDGYAIYLDGEHFRVGYPSGAHGYGFRYGRFVQKLRTHLDLHESVEKIEGRVTSVERDGHGRVVGLRYRSGAEGRGPQRSLRGRLSVVSPGSATGLRRELAAVTPQVKGHMLGMLLEGDCLPHAGHGHVIIARPAPILAYPVASQLTRVLIDFPDSIGPRKKDDLKRYLNEKVAPQLPERLRDAFGRSVAAGGFRTKATHLLAARPQAHAGVVLLGDALNMRHPVTGAGMTAALTDVEQLGAGLIGASSFAEWSAVVERFYRERHKKNATLNILAFALYRVFMHPKLRSACFEYLKRGGSYSAEPMSILSGLSRSRTLLLRHFISVAIAGVAAEVGPVPTPSRLLSAWRVLRDAAQIVMPLLREERPGPAMRLALDVGTVVFPKRS